jgi:hypothetical protein
MDEGGRMRGSECNEYMEPCPGVGQQLCAFMKHSEEGKASV